MKILLDHNAPHGLCGALDYHEVHTADYLDREWSKRFRILDTVVHGIGNQDVLVLQAGP